MSALPRALAPIFAAPLLAQAGLWSELTFPVTPGPKYDTFLVYDIARDRLVLVGGQPTSTPVNPQTWENDGTQWVQRTTFGSYQYPSIGAVYDEQRQRTVAVLMDAGSQFTQTWEWDGTVWQLRTPLASPPGRNNFAMAYDSARGRTVLFGGSSGGVHTSDTWEWDGNVWLLRSTGGPAPRQEHAMAFDTARNVTVLFGGRYTTGSLQTFADTWEWNGTFWQQMALGMQAPAARSQHRMAFDRQRQRTALYGGMLVGGVESLDTWEWSGSAWTNKMAGNSSCLRPGMTYDTLRQRTVLYGGIGLNNAVQNKTWAYTVPSQVASTAVYGTGCAGPAGIPQITPLLGDTPRLGTSFQVSLTNLPVGPQHIPVGWLGYDNTSWAGVALPLALDPAGFPGCFALLAPAAAYVLQNSGGSATWSVAIPFLPALAGLHFFMQGAVLVVGFNPGGLVFTPGLRGTVGG